MLESRTDLKRCKSVISHGKQKGINGVASPLVSVGLCRPATTCPQSAIVAGAGACCPDVRDDRPLPASSIPNAAAPSGSICILSPNCYCTVQQVTAIARVRRSSLLLSFSLPRGSNLEFTVICARTGRRLDRKRSQKETRSEFFALSGASSFRRRRRLRCCGCGCFGPVTR